MLWKILKKMLQKQSKIHAETAKNHAEMEKNPAETRILRKRKKEGFTSFIDITMQPILLRKVRAGCSISSTSSSSLSSSSNFLLLNRYSWGLLSFSLSTKSPICSSSGNNFTPRASKDRSNTKSLSGPNVLGTLVNKKRFPH